MEPILFWGTFNKTTGQKIPYGEFSNFAKYPYTIHGVTYKTSEHYYQAAKFLNDEDRQEVLAAPDAKTAAMIGRDRSKPLRSDWEEVKDDVMREAVWFKFINYPGLIQTLLGTGDAGIIEASPIDSYWGWGRDKQGKNMLGKILMETREKLQHTGFVFAHKEAHLKNGLIH